MEPTTVINQKVPGRVGAANRPGHRLQSISVMNFESRQDRSRKGRFFIVRWVQDFGKSGVNAGLGTVGKG